MRVFLLTFLDILSFSGVFLQKKTFHLFAACSLRSQLQWLDDFNATAITSISVASSSLHYARCTISRPYQPTHTHTTSIFVFSRRLQHCKITQINSQVSVWNCANKPSNIERQRQLKKKFGVMRFVKIFLLNIISLYHFCTL